MTKMTLEEKLTKALAGHPTDDVIPVLTAYLAGIAVWSGIPPNQLVAFVSDVILSTYAMNDTPPKEEMN